VQFIFIVLLFLIVVPSFYAKSYVQLTNYTTKHKAFFLTTQLHRLGLHVIVKRKIGSYYSLYIGPYSNVSEAMYQKKRLQRYFPKSKILTFKSKDQTESENHRTVKSQDKILNKQSLWSSSFNVGYSSFPSTHIIQEGTIAIKEPKTDGFSQLLGLNYLWNSNVLVGFNLMRMSSSDLVFTNGYISLDYKFKKITQTYFPYFGILSGYSLLTWNIDPVGNSKTSENNSQSFFYGTHVGVVHPLSSVWDFVIDYQCIFMNHTTNLTKKGTTDRSKLQHNLSNTLQIGLRYHF